MDRLDRLDNVEIQGKMYLQDRMDGLDLLELQD
jgi:hypothetical protein